LAFHLTVNVKETSMSGRELSVLDSVEERLAEAH